MASSMSPVTTTPAVSGPLLNGGSLSPPQALSPKNVAFELMFSNSPQYRARLPMRVQIYPHDTTDSIVTTVKNFYGLYAGPAGSKGVSFEDDHGNTLIARYENFRNNMIVHVRVIEETAATSAPRPIHPATSMSSEPCYASESHQGQPAAALDQDAVRPNSRASRRRSPSPNAARARRSDSVSTSSKKGRSRPVKSRRSAAQNHADGHSDSLNGYSSGDGAPSTQSAKTKEHLGNTDISVDNIVEGGRRKRAKFESSELPLFAPPQMPAATSNPSVSPARRVEHHRPSLPFVQPGQNPFTNPRPLQSPQSLNSGIAQSIVYATPAPRGHRSRGSVGYSSGGYPVTAGLGVLPTPDPTVGSCVSEEDKDVAIQLMRLGEPANIPHGRNSASTLDDAFSGIADAASSTGATSDGDSQVEDELPAARRQKLDADCSTNRVYETTEKHFAPSTDGLEAGGEVAGGGRAANGAEGDMQACVARGKLSLKHKASPAASSAANKSGKSAKAPGNIKVAKKQPAAIHGPMSPASTPHSRKPSVASSGKSTLPAEDQPPDLSTKPRCQRCRKSKKGCDRQRPCGRCRDAGLSADQCISEDEGNGRKGRYGRHMGVPIKKDEPPFPTQAYLLPAAPIVMAAATTGDKSKKRKR